MMNIIRIVVLAVSFSVIIPATATAQNGPSSFTVQTQNGLSVYRATHNGLDTRAVARLKAQASIAKDAETRALQARRDRRSEQRLIRENETLEAENARLERMANRPRRYGKVYYGNPSFFGSNGFIGNRNFGGATVLFGKGKRGKRSFGRGRGGNRR